MFTPDGFRALAARARGKKEGVKSAQDAGEEGRSANSTDQVAADEARAKASADRDEAGELEALVSQAIVVVPGDDEGHVSAGSFVALRIQPDNGPETEVVKLLCPPPVALNQLMTDYLSPSSAVGSAVLGQPVGSKLQVGTRTNGNRGVTIVRSQRPQQVPTPKTKL
jgi:transcription elongation GreA/GreB family factor